MRPALTLAASVLFFSMLITACGDRGPAATAADESANSSASTGAPDAEPAVVAPEAEMPAVEPVTPSPDDAMAEVPADAPAEAPLRPSYAACIAGSGGVVPTMQDCIAKEYVFQDGRLNTAFRNLRADLPKTEADALRDAQRDWLKRRDAECTWDAATEGQGQRIAANECSLRWAATRATELEAMRR